MPNHVINRITSPNIIAIKKLMVNRHLQFDFNRILPMPRQLINTQSPAKIVTPAEYKIAKKEYAIARMTVQNPEFFLNLPITQAMSDRYIAKYGHNNWFEWSVANWDTKWNAYETDLDGSDYVSFQTAWSAPFKVIQAISKKLQCSVTLEYADEDRGVNCGIVEFYKGSVISDIECAEDFAAKMWGDSEEDVTSVDDKIKETIRLMSNRKPE